MTSRVDMHCHSTASQLSRLGVQRSLGLPECATPPQEVYELAKRRGMDFVTITDHDTIDGCLELAGRPDCFVSEELTARFAGEPQAVHVLCYGITPGDHEWLQAHSGDVEACAAYLHENEIACALAHPFYNVAAPLTQRHRRLLAELFPVWEVRNGSRAAELNMPAVVYIETHGGTGIGGSDDHAGVDIGRTFTEAPAAATPEEFLRHLRRGDDAVAGGEQGSAAKWAHAAMALATRALVLDGRTGEGGAPDPAAVLKMAQRVIGEGAAREGKVAADIGPDDARALLEAWLRRMGLEMRGRELLDHLQSDGFSHADLYRRARRIHERRLRAAVGAGAEAVARGDAPAAIAGLFEALVPAVPYAPSAAFLGAEKAKLAAREGEPRRVALIADGIGSMHGVTHTIEQIRERGVPGFEVEVVGTDAGVDRRLPAAAELEVPFYEGMRLGVPGPARPGRDPGRGPLRPRPRHRARPGRDRRHPAQPRHRDAAARQLPHRAGRLRAACAAGTDGLEAMAEAALRRLLRRPLGRPLAEPGGGPLPDSARRRPRPDRPLGARRRHLPLRPGEGRSRRLPRRAEGPLRRPAHPREGGRPARRELPARARSDPRLHLLLAGGGPEEARAAGAAGRARHLPRLAGGRGPGPRLRQRRHLPLLQPHRHLRPGDRRGGRERAAGGRRRRGRAGRADREPPHGMLCRPDADHLAGAVLQLASSPLLRRHLGASAARAARARSWERALDQLAAGYRRALGDAAAAGERQALARAA